MMILKKYTTLALIAVFTLTVKAQKTKEQEEEDRLNGGSITVVKAYDPTISDAFKVNSVPQINDTTKVKKKPVTYRIYSVPVASTFTPTTGTLNKLKRKQREKFFDNYARLGLGNYVNVLGEFATNFEIDKDSDLGIFLNHNSSQGGIDEVEADNGFSDTSLDLSYGARSKNFNWGITAGGRYRTANWYGDYENTPVALTEDTDVGLNYFSYGIGGKAAFFDSTFKSVDVLFNGVTSGEGASEIRFRAQPELQFNIMESEIDLGLDVDYLSGSFDTPALRFAPENYSYLNAGINPSINLYGDNYKIELGARLNYLSDVENSEGSFNVYPDINASYILVEELLVGFTQIGGGLDMNSLQGFSEENIFLAPSIIVAPTDRLVDATLGIKGKLDKRFGYKLYGGYRIEENRAFYTSDAGFSVPGPGRNAYEYGNVFYTQYGDMNTFTGGLGLNYETSSGFNIAINGTFMSYDVTSADAFQNTASHLPDFTADLIAEYQIDPKWNVGATLFYVGERDAYRNGVGVETLDGFVDLNLDVNYKINPKLSVFLRGNNLTGGNYEMFAAYPVQNLQVLGGAVYKFDF